MAEVFVEFEDPIVASNGSVYRARACGAQAVDGTSRWEGWVEFLPIGGGEALRSRRETTQPNRADTAYWATGLSHVYLQGTLERTLDPAPPVIVPGIAAEPVFAGPAPSGVLPLEPQTPSVLNPFSVYRKGETMLRNQLSALSGWHLVNIIRAYDLSTLEVPALERASQRDLVDLIVLAVQARAGS